MWKTGNERGVPLKFSVHNFQSTDEHRWTQIFVTDQGGGKTVGARCSVPLRNQKNALKSVGAAREPPLRHVCISACRKPNPCWIPVTGRRAEINFRAQNIGQPQEIAPRSGHRHAEQIPLFIVHYNGEGGTRTRTPFRWQTAGGDGGCPPNKKTSARSEGLWWGRRDSNPHASRHLILSQARLPIPTLPRTSQFYSIQRRWQNTQRVKDAKFPTDEIPFHAARCRLCCVCRLRAAACASV